MPRTMQRLAAAFAIAGAAARGADPEEAPEARGSRIERIDLIHVSHTDYGFTDHPIVCRELQRRYLDIALDAATATRELPEDRKFRWTAETTVAVLDWWQAATPARREAFLDAVRGGQIEVAALPLNNTPLLDRHEWRQMLDWLPSDLWAALRPRVAIQNDVNGFPRAGALALLDRGIRHILTGINEDSGGAPFRRPSGFWWRMPDGRRLFVWLSYSYPAGYDLFEPREWRQGPLPLAGDARFRPPRAGDILRSDEASVRAAHRHCLARLRAIEAAGYPHRRLLLSITNQWRIDNDPPFPPLAEFVGAWNALGLRPALRLTTPSVAMEALEREIGGAIPEHAGEWTDWWVNGIASSPREVSASRFAKRSLAAARSPLWGPLDENGRRVIEELTKDLCLFDEHTWGSANSVAFPDTLDAVGQFNEKSLLAYRPMARAEWLLSQRVRLRTIREPEGLYVANPAARPWSGWVTMPVTCLREPYVSVEDPATGARRQPIAFEPGVRPWTRPQGPGELTRENRAATFADNVPARIARFWVDDLPAHSIRALRLSTRPAEAEAPAPAGPAIERDAGGWPARVSWDGMEAPLFLPGTGDINTLRVLGFAPRWRMRDIWGIGDEAARDLARREGLEEIGAEADGATAVRDTPHTVTYTQALRHPRLRTATRIIEIWKREARVRYTLRIDRISSPDPEVLFATFVFPCEEGPPQASSGGEPFVPFRDQLPGTCRDYFAVDSWVHYATPRGSWIWATRDAPLVSIGAHNVLAKRTREPDSPGRLYAMLFNNLWYTNFAGDSHGAMEFRFEIAWRKGAGGPTEVEEIAESLLAEPVVAINPALPESPILIERLYTP